jgi:hypothetical protein
MYYHNGIKEDGGALPPLREILLGWRGVFFLRAA